MVNNMVSNHYHHYPPIIMDNINGNNYGKY